MEFEIEIKNYRCFPDSRPARIILSEGFIAFVGVNNSGKSSLLRFFYELRTLFSQIANDWNVLNSAFRGQPVGLTLAGSVADADEIFNNTNDRDLKISLRIREAPSGKQITPPMGTELRITILRRSKQWVAEIPGHSPPSDVNQFYFNNNWHLTIRGSVAADLNLIKEACGWLSNTLYVGPFRNALNMGSGQDYYDIKVGQSFIAEWRERKTGGNIAQNEAMIRLTGEIRRIFEFESLEIDASSDNATLKLFVNRRSFKLGELGAGLTQFILLLANAAIRRPAIILIDEPELNLHPSLQIDFLTTLASYCGVGLLFGTHSVGLARSVTQRIYSLRRIKEGETEVREFDATTNLTEFLGELSFSGYQELGYDKILLVEGPTDVTTFQQFLRIYGKDHKIVVLPLGGKSFITKASGPQLAELKRISSNIVAVIDSERKAPGDALEPDRLAFTTECKNLGIQCHVLERRATENYFTDRAVKLARGPAFRAPTSYEELGDLSPSWHKRENWRIAREMDQSETDSTDLGQILKAL